MTLAGVTDEALDLDAHLRAVDHRTAGAVATFSGTVRDHDHGRSVTALEYHAHPTAGRVVAEVAAQVAARWEVEAVAVTHRTGLLQIGDVAIVAAVSAAHRGAAFGALAELVDEVKKQLPVWKKQQFADGTHEWVGST